MRCNQGRKREIYMKVWWKGEEGTGWIEEGMGWKREEMFGTTMGVSWCEVCAFVVWILRRTCSIEAWGGKRNGECRSVKYPYIHCLFRCIGYNTRYRFLCNFFISTLVFLSSSKSPTNVIQLLEEHLVWTRCELWPMCELGVNYDLCVN